MTFIDLFAGIGGFRRGMELAKSITTKRVLIGYRYDIGRYKNE